MKPGASSRSSMLVQRPTELSKLLLFKQGVESVVEQLGHELARQLSQPSLKEDLCSSFSNSAFQIRFLKDLLKTL